MALTDTNAAWSKSLGLSADMSDRGFGIRTARYAMILNDLKVEYVEVRSFPSFVMVKERSDVLCLEPGRAQAWRYGV